MLAELGVILNLAQRLSVLDRLKRALLLQKDESYDQLVAVLAEISKIYGAINQELTRYLAIQVDEDDTGPARRELLDLEGQQIRLRVGEARGHCHRIYNIHQRYLDPWFRRVLNDDEYSETRELFGRLAGADGSMLVTADDLANWLGAEASATLTLVDSGDFAAANERIRRARLEVLDARKQLIDTVVMLQDLQSEFIRASGIV